MLFVSGKTRYNEERVRNMSKTVYIADDEANIRDLIRLFFSNDGYEAAAFESGDALMAAFTRRPADLVVLDVMMPGTDGLALCSKIRSVSDAFIIIVSARDSETDRIAGITLGSDDYLTKPFSPMELVTRANALFRRRARALGGDENAPLAFANLRLCEATREATVDGCPLELTPTEYALTVYLLQNSARAVSRGELLRHIWKCSEEMDTRATDDVVKRLRRKLAAANAAFAIDAVWGFGFRLTKRDTP